MNTSKNKQRIKPLNNNDRRIQRTKQSLRDALFVMLEKKSIEKITVSEITAVADVNRSTFYFYYENMEDMMNKIQEEIFETFKNEIIVPDSNFTKLEDFVNYIAKFLVFCKNNYEVCRFVTSNGCNNNLANRIRIEVEKVIPNSVNVYDETDPKHYLTTFAVSGILYSILEWMNNGMKSEPDEMAEFLASVYVFGSAKVKASQKIQLIKK